MNNMTEYNQIDEMTIAWPFYRYTVLIPEQVRGDLFVWLYLSLIIFKNNELKLNSLSYTEEVKESVSDILKAKFSSVISSGDQSNLSKIIENAEKDYLEDNENGKHLKEETLDFINTYSELFSDNLQVKYIYQDGITGEVLPYFGENMVLDESENGFKLFFNSRVKFPTKQAIKRAYRQYDSLKKNNSIEIEEEFDEIEEKEVEYNPFNQVDEEDAFFDDFDEVDDVFTESKTAHSDKIDTRNFNVVYLDNTKVEMSYDVKVHIVDNMIVVDSPFGNRTDIWMNRCFNKARNISSFLEEKLSTFEQSSNVSETKDTSKKNIIETYKKDVADSLVVCGPLYRLAESLNNKDLQDLVIKIDYSYKNNNNEGIFNQIGRYLECLVQPIIKSDNDYRKRYTHQFYCNEIAYQAKSINYNYLLKESIFIDWKKGAGHSFKGDIADLILNSNLGEKAYYDFIEDLFKLYNIRNQYSHYNNETKEVITKNHIDSLLKVSKVLAELL